MIDSCKFAMGNSSTSPVNPYHGNWAIRYKEVECPEGLTKVTGLRLKEPTISYNNTTLEKPSKDMELARSVGSVITTCKKFATFHNTRITATR